MSYRDKRDTSGRRKLLTCDSGGIPRMISIGALVELSAGPKAKYFAGLPVAS